jgi:zinc protease
MMSVALTAVLAFAALNDNTTVDRKAGVPKPGPVQPFAIQTPTEFKLKNGVKVEFIERHRAPLVDVIAVVDGGALFDPADKPGLAQFTAQMLTEGAGDMDAIAFANAQTAIAAQVFGFAEADFAGVGVHVGSDHFADAAKLFAAALTSPKNTDDDWKRIQKNTVGFYMYASQDPDTLASFATARAVWGKDNRLGWNIGGTPKSLLAIGAADLKSFHDVHYRPDTTTLVVVGDVDRATFEKTMNDVLAKWTAPKDPPPAAVKVAQPVATTARSVVEVALPGAQQTVLSMVNPIPADTKRFDPAVNVTNSIIGGSFSSRLNLSLREKDHYTYGAHSSFAISNSGGYFVAQAPVATPVTGKSVVEMTAQLESMEKSPPNDDEVTRARNNEALTFPASFGSGRTMTGVWASTFANKIDPARVKSFMDGALKIDAKTVSATSAKLIKPSIATLVVVGDLDAVGKDVASFGPVTKLTLDDLMPGLQEAAMKLGGGGPGGE